MVTKQFELNANQIAHADDDPSELEGFVCKLAPEVKYALSRTNNKRLMFFYRGAAYSYICDFLSATISGDEKTVLKMLDQHPSLLFEKNQLEITDYSGRTYSGLSAYQIALHAGDEVMTEKMRAHYLRQFPDERTKFDEEFNAVFPRGYALHLIEQKENTFNFESILTAIENASPSELEAALANPDIDSTLGQALAAFRNAFTTQSLNEKIFNPNHLLQAFAIYNTKFAGWYVNTENKQRWLKLDLFWRQVIGHVQRYLPANYAQAFCTGVYDMVNSGQPLIRILKLRNIATNRELPFFPLDADATSLLGRQFAVDSYLGSSGCGWSRRAGGALGGSQRLVIFKMFLEQKQQPWKNYAAQMQTSHSVAIKLK